MLINECHEGLGSHAKIDNVTWSAGDSTNEETPSSYVAALAIGDYTDGDVSFSTNPWGVAAIVAYTSYKHTGADGLIDGIDVEPTINTDSTGNLTGVVALRGEPINYGSGDIGFMTASYARIQHLGKGTLASGCGLATSHYVSGSTQELLGTAMHVYVDQGTNVPTNTGHKVQQPTLANGGTITDNTGILIEDQSGAGITNGINLQSNGVNGRNVFEGGIEAGTAISVAQLPPPGHVGRRLFVTDASTPVFGQILAGGGTYSVPVYDDGTKWRAG